VEDLARFVALGRRAATAHAAGAADAARRVPQPPQATPLFKNIDVPAPSVQRADFQKAERLPPRLLPRTSAGIFSPPHAQAQARGALSPQDEWSALPDA
jgi:hypothetical protein